MKQELLDLVGNPKFDPFFVLSNVILVNFDENDLGGNSELVNRIMDLKNSVKFDLKMSTKEFKKAMKYEYSSDSLLKEYGGQLEEPIFNLSKFKGQ